ncbi:hypothetical protein [Klenkia sp. PcliD-1-E]|uniref:hypothetical protein n=1 Tax=Klenkia sp. PcliD-1-E TaxID=2954492 RepID=UPI002097A8E9|nr:hypothetical protein [Klenkia sp. PcliD-1-E]MCO7221196.1 hypothetical protein [Klenkia sp. PcliD-1-E]
MGKHTALDGASVHPLVADALERRQHVAAWLGAPNVVQRQRAEVPSTAVGWPVAPQHADGLGWPGVDLDQPRDADHPDDDGSVLAVLDSAAEQEVGSPGPPARRTGWRRFFGASSTRPTTAA